ALCAGIKKRERVIRAAFSKSWRRRLREISRTDPAVPEAGTCRFLYFNMTLDGAGRIMPCCMAPGKYEKKLVFANFGPGHKSSPLEFVNSPMAAMARESFADRPSYERKAASLGPN